MELSVLSYNIEGLSLISNYCHDQTLKSYIKAKNICLHDYLITTDCDIICIQEYTSVLLPKLANYNFIKSDINSNAIFYKTHIIHHKNWTHNSTLFAELIVNDILIQIATDRLPAGSANAQVRADILRDLDKNSQNTVRIISLDANMRKWEDVGCLLDNLTDCYYSAKHVSGTYTIDKRANPYFDTDANSQYLIQTRYDKIFHTSLFLCKSLQILMPTKINTTHVKYPFSSLSDHFPIKGIFNL